MASADEPIVLSDDDDEPPLAKRRAGKEPETGAGAAGPRAAGAGGAAGPASSPEVIEIEDVQVRCCSCNAVFDQDETTSSSECSHPVCAGCLQALVQKAGQESGPISLRLVCPSKPSCSGQLRFAALGCAPKGAVKQDAPTKVEKQLFAEVKERAAAARTAQRACSCGAQMKLLSDDKVGPPPAQSCVVVTFPALSCEPLTFLLRLFSLQLQEPTAAEVKSCVAALSLAASTVAEKKAALKKLVVAFPDSVKRKVRGHCLKHSWRQMSPALPPEEALTRPASAATRGY